VQRLKNENVELARVNQELESTVAEVQGRLDEFEERTARLALAAGMEAEAVSFSGGGGSQTRVGSGGPYDRLSESPESLTAQGRWVQRQLDLVEGRLTEQGRVLASTPTIAPVLGLITDGFGRRKDPFTGRLAFHRGLDVSARRGTPIKAPADGIVVFAGRNGSASSATQVARPVPTCTTRFTKTASPRTRCTSFSTRSRHRSLEVSQRAHLGRVVRCGRQFVFFGGRIRC